ncbi:hypothetical protein E2C01_077662 [Portunus trituberculatus]|uniref:Uncharacterized protein n=1 Tax=Portunus trituberculatus TaxID=210409 RepID=A0A5B7IKS7_PORTR|nr:hypothetical protein [Portunus trituberculatus]
MTCGGEMVLRTLPERRAQSVRSAHHFAAGTWPV